MSVRSSQSITALFTTRVFSSGVGTNADSLPTGTLYVNGVANGATVTVANVSTGLYTAAVTLPTLAVGDEVEIIIAATVSSVSDKAVIWGDTKDVVIDSAGLVDANTVKLGPTGSGTAQTARDLGQGIPNAVPGASGGLLIAGSNAATTFAALTSTASFTVGSFVNNGVTDVAQTGDSFARIGANGASLTALAPSSTALSTATWTGALATSLTTLAGHDPGATLASQTNITAGTITNVTNLTNAPTSGDLTAAMKASVQTACDSAITANATIIEIELETDGIAAIPTNPLLTSDVRLNHLDADVSSRMATYTQPTGFLAAAFPAGTVASTTNIVSGSVTLLSTGLDAVTVAGKTLPNAIKYIGAAVSGKCSGAGTGTETYDDFSGATAFVATIDTNGNRTGMAYS